MRRRAHRRLGDLRPGRAAAPGGSRSVRCRRRRQHHDMAAGAVGRPLAPPGVPLVAHGPPAAWRHRQRRGRRAGGAATARPLRVRALRRRGRRQPRARRRADRRARPRPGTGPRRRAGLRSARPAPGAGHAARSPDRRPLRGQLAAQQGHPRAARRRSRACRTTPSRCTSPDAKTWITATPAGSAGSSRTAGSPGASSPTDRSTARRLLASTPARTCSCCRPASRRTAPPSPRRSGPVCRRSAGARETCRT